MTLDAMHEPRMQVLSAKRQIGQFRYYVSFFAHVVHSNLGSFCPQQKSLELTRVILDVLVYLKRSYIGIIPSMCKLHIFESQLGN